MVSLKYLSSFMKLKKKIILASQIKEKERKMKEGREVGSRAQE